MFCACCKRNHALVNGCLSCICSCWAHLYLQNNTTPTSMFNHRRASAIAYLCSTSAFPSQLSTPGPLALADPYPLCLEWRLLHPGDWVPNKCLSRVFLPCDSVLKHLNPVFKAEKSRPIKLKDEDPYILGKFNNYLPNFNLSPAAFLGQTISSLCFCFLLHGARTWTR